MTPEKPAANRNRRGESVDLRLARKAVHANHGKTHLKTGETA